MTLTAAYPYFGSKRAAASRIWVAFGVDVPNYVDACCGSASVLWARPAPGKVETLNDAFGAIPNFLRALKRMPDAVAEHASWPVSELDMHARHRWLVEKMDEAFVERLRREPTFCDPEVAGYWVWGQSIWIGSGWCASGHGGSTNTQRPALSGGTKGKNKKRPNLAGHGHKAREGYPKGGVGIFRDSLRTPTADARDGLHHKLPELSGIATDGPSRANRRGVMRTGLAKAAGMLPEALDDEALGDEAGEASHQLPHLIGPNNRGVGYGRGIFSSTRSDLLYYFRALSQRLQRVRITCGDWKRVVTPAVTTSHGMTAVLLDPPYGEEAKRTKRLYAVDDADTAAAMRAWCVRKGDDPFLRIVLCGYEGEHEELEKKGWRCVSWKSNGGYGNQDGENANAGRERLWLSPHCLRAGEQTSLFEEASA